MFGILILVHELGHFLAARKAGVDVEEFAIGMGPTIWKKQGKHTLYSIKLLPIGGFVLLEGEDEASDSARAFNNKSKLSRIGILVAGALMNILFGLLLIIIMYSTSGADGFVTRTIREVSLPEQTAFQAGDTIVKLDGYGTLNYTDVNFAISNIDSETTTATVLRDGERIKLEDVPFIKAESGYKLGVTMEVEPFNLWTVLKNSLTQCLSMVRLVWVSLVYLVTGKVGLSQLTGPVGITAMIEETVHFGITPVLNIVSLIAVNLGVVNLLPLPALDGGRIFFILVEAVIRKPIPPQKEGLVHMIGFILLMVLTVFVFVNDIIRVVS